MENADRCSMCGTSRWQWDEDPYAFEPLFDTCIGCQKKELLSQDDTPKPAGTSVRLFPKAEAERLRLERELHPPQRPKRRG